MNVKFPKAQYTVLFDKTAKTVTINGVGGISSLVIHSIKNITADTVIYAIGDPNLKATIVRSLSADTLVATLSYDTSAMNNADYIDVTCAADGNELIFDSLVSTGLSSAVTSVDLGARADAAATTDTGTFSLIALTKRLLSKLTAGITVGGKLAKVTDSFTTASGATAYAVSDVINASGAATLRSINVGTNSGYLVGLAVEMDNTSPLTTPNPLPTLRVRFFDATDASLAIADNSPDEVLYANNVRRLGHVDLPIMVAEGNRLIASDETIRFPFANLTSGLLYYKIINTVGTPTLGTASVGRGVFVRAKTDQN